MTSRFTLVERPALEPGTDAVTGSTVGPFVDTGTWIQPSPKKRRLYLSVDTIRELAEVAGIIDSPNNPVALAQARAEGALEVIRENLGGDLARVLRRLDTAVLEPLDLARDTELAGVDR